MDLRNSALNDQRTLVETYLNYCRKRNADAAQGFWAPGAKVIFPGAGGGRSFSSVPEMFAANDRRFASAQKRPEFCVTGTRSSDDRSVIISAGTLHGVDLDGDTFANIRYLDLFVLHGDKIAEQLVWNDLAEQDL